MTIKLTKEQIEKLREGRKAGASQMKLAKEFDISLTTVRYWTDEKLRQTNIKKAGNYFKKLPPEKRREINQKQKAYRTKYVNKRYHADPKFRKKMIDSTMKWKRKMQKEREEAKKETKKEANIKDIPETIIS